MKNKNIGISWNFIILRDLCTMLCFIILISSYPLVLYLWKHWSHKSLILKVGLWLCLAVADDTLRQVVGGIETIACGKKKGFNNRYSLWISLSRLECPVSLIGYRNRGCAVLGKKKKKNKTYNASVSNKSGSSIGCLVFAKSRLCQLLLISRNSNCSEPLLILIRAT